MKIIKQGMLPEKALMRGQCWNCKCEVECERWEAEGCTDPRDNITIYTIKCPTLKCERHINLGEIKTP